MPLPGQKKAHIKEIQALLFRAFWGLGFQGFVVLGDVGPIGV